MAAPATADAPKKAAAAASPAGFRQLRLLCIPPDAPPSSTVAALASFRRHDPLVPAAHGSFQSYESLSHPKHFISSFGAPPAARVRGARHAYHGAGAGELGELRQLGLVPRPTAPATSSTVPTPFALESTFEEAIGEAEYPPSAWWLLPRAPAKGPPPDTALVYSLAEVVDETYSAYWSLS